MPEDIRLTMGGEPERLVSALDKVDKKLDQTAGSAKKAAETVHDLARDTDQGEVDFAGLGKKSKRASAEIERLGQALAGLGSGQLTPHEFLLVFKNITGTMGSLAAASGKAGGAIASLAPILGTVAGLAGPVALAIAGVSALTVLWHKFNAEAEQSAEKVKSLKEHVASLHEQVRQMEQATARAFAPKAPAEQTNVFQHFLRDVNAPGQQVPLFGSAIDVFTKQQQRERVFPGANQAEQIENARKETIQLIEDAANGQFVAQQKLLGLIDRIEQRQRQSVDRPSETVEAVVSAFQRARNATKQEADAKEEEAAAAERQKTAKEEEAIDAERAQRVQQAIAAAMDKGLATIKPAIDAGEDLDELLSRLTEALKEEGFGEQGITGILHGIRQRLNEEKTGLAHLNKLLADEIAERERLKNEAAARQKALDEEHRKAEEQKAEEEKGRDQQAIAQMLPQAIRILEQLNGNTTRLHDRLVHMLTGAGISPLRAQAMAGDLTRQAGQQREQGELQRRLGMAAQAEGRGLGERMKAAVQTARDEAKAQGRAFGPREVAAAQEQERQRFARETKENREALRGAQAERRKQVEEQQGGPLTPAQRRAFRQQEAQERGQLQRPRRSGETPGAEGIEQVKEQAQELNENFPQFVQDITNGFQVMATTIANMNNVSLGARNALRQAIQSLPGPGTRR